MTIAAVELGAPNTGEDPPKVMDAGKGGSTMLEISCWVMRRDPVLVTAKDVIMYIERNCGLLDSQMLTPVASTDWAPATGSKHAWLWG